MLKYQIFDNTDKLIEFYQLFKPDFKPIKNHSLQLVSVNKHFLNERVICLDRILAKKSEYEKLINEIKVQLVGKEKSPIKLLDLKKIKQSDYSTDIRIMLMDLSSLSDIEIVTYFANKQFRSVLPLFFIGEMEIMYYFDIDINGKLWVELNCKYPDLACYDYRKRGKLAKRFSLPMTKQTNI